MNKSLATRPSARRKSGLRTWIRALDAIKIIDEAPDVTLVSLLDGLADQHGDRVALTGEGETLTFRELAVRANRYARWAIAQGLRDGDVVCLLMPNRPEYVAIWLGLTRARCVAALLNTNLVGDGLAHCIAAAGSAHLIVDSALVPRAAAIQGKLSPATRVWTHGGPVPAAGWPDIVSRSSDRTARHSPAASDGRRHPDDELCWSSRPEPPDCPRRHHRARAYNQWSFWFAGMMNAQPERSDVQLSADVSQRRRHSRDRRDAGQRRVGGNPREILGQPVLGRHRR